MGVCPEERPGALRQVDNTVGTKVRLLNAEAMEALLSGRMTWAPRRDQCNLLTSTHHRLLIRVIGYRRTRGHCRQLSYAQTLEKGRMPKRGNETDATVCWIIGRTTGRVTPEASDSRRHRWGGEPGHGVPGTELGEILGGRLDIVRRHQRIHGGRQENVRDTADLLDSRREGVARGTKRLVRGQLAQGGREGQ